MASSSGTQTEISSSPSTRHYHHLPRAFLWSFPILMLSVLLLWSLETFTTGLRSLVQRVPAGFARNLGTGVLSVLERALGGGHELPLSLTAVLLAAVLIALLVLAIGIFELVGLKSEEMHQLRGVRHEALTHEAQPAPQRATRQRRAS